MGHDSDRRYIPFDTDNKDKLGLLINEECAILLAGASQADLFALLITVLLDVALRTLEDNTTLLLVGLV